MLRAGIPAWHLPGEILDAEIAKLPGLGGIEIRCGVRVGDDPDGVTLDYLRPPMTRCSSPSARMSAGGSARQARRPGG